MLAPDPVAFTPVSRSQPQAPAPRTSPHVLFCLICHLTLGSQSWTAGGEGLGWDGLAMLGNSGHIILAQQPLRFGKADIDNKQQDARKEMTPVTNKQREVRVVRENTRRHAQQTNTQPRTEVQGKKGIKDWATGARELSEGNCA